MSPILLRWCAVPLGLLAFAMRVAATFWLQPLTWRMGFPIGLLALLVVHLAALLIPLGMFVLLIRRGRHRAGFLRRDGRFVAAPAPRFTGVQAILWMFLSATMVMTERVPNGDTMRIAELAWPASVIGVGVFWAAALAWLLVQRPRLELDARGLTIRRLRRRMRLAWDSLAPGGPLPPIERRPRHLTVYLNAPTGSAPPPSDPPWPNAFSGFRPVTPPSENIPIGWLHVEPAYLAGAIRHYVEHPEHRAAIGSPQELARLQQAVAGTTSGEPRASSVV